MNTLKNKKLALFFSAGISLKDWEDIGHIDREVRFYNDLSNNFEKVYFLTYGKDDLNLKHRVNNEVKILHKKNSLPNLLHYVLLPFIYSKELKDSDIFKTNQMSAALPAMVAKIIYRKKLIVRCGYEWLKVLEMENKALWKRVIVCILEGIAYKTADKIVFSSNKDKKFAQDKFNIKEEKIILIPNYIDINLFKPEEKDKNGIIYIGRLSKEKNLFNLVKAMKGLNEKLTLIGAGSLENDLRELAHDVGVNVDFRGKIANAELPQEINKHKIFVLPSFYEGSPKALLEAMGCGVCCLATDVEGINEVIKHKENGFLTNTNSESINQGLTKLLNDNDLCVKLGESARQTILNNFSLEYILNKELNIYKNLNT